MKNGSRRPVFLSALALGALLLLIGDRTETGSRIIYWHSLAAEKSQANPAWGYRLENHRLVRSMRLTLLGFQEAPWSYRQNGANVKKISEIRWLARGQAVYLDLIIEHEDSGVAEDFRTRVICDFEKHSLILGSKLTLWRPYDWKKGDPSKSWTTDKEFDTALSAYGSPN